MDRDCLAVAGSRSAALRWFWHQSRQAPSAPIEGTGPGFRRSCHRRHFVVGPDRAPQGRRREYYRTGDGGRQGGRGSRVRRSRLPANDRRHREREIEHSAGHLHLPYRSGRNAIHRCTGRRPSQRCENSGSDRRIRRRLLALAGLSSPAQPGRSRRPLPPFALAMEDAVFGFAAPQESSGYRRNHGFRRRFEYRRGERARAAAEIAGARLTFSSRGDDRPADRARVRGRLVVHDRRSADRDPFAARTDSRRRRPRDCFRAGPRGRSAGSRPACRGQRGAAFHQDRDPLFLAGRATVDRAQLATLRGVDVNIVLPGTNNHLLVAWAAQAHIRPLLQTGCRVWHSSPPFDHSKLMTIDSEWSLVGSANWDTRSLRLNFELTVEFYDSNLTDRLAGIIDKHRNRPITLEEINNRPFIWKLRDAAARLAMPYI